MKRQAAALLLGAAFILATAGASFAQGNGNAVGGGAAGGPNGVYKNTPNGPAAKDTGSGSGYGR